MVQKKSNYWDQIFANQVPETEDVSKEEENVLDFTGKTPNQEHDVRVREIFFAEDGAGEEAPDAKQDEPETEMTTTSLVANEETAEPAGMVVSIPLDANSDFHTENEAENDLFFGWTQTTKSYSRLNFEGKEPIEKKTVEETVAEMADGSTPIAVEPEKSQLEAGNEVEAEDAEAEKAEESDGSEEKAEVTNSRPILSEDGSLSVTLNRYAHPMKGFGFGLLDEEVEETDEAEPDEAEEVEADSETAKVEIEASEELNVEKKAETIPDGLDSWGSLAFELGLPVTLPEKEPEAAVQSVPCASAKVKKEAKSTKPAKEEKPAKTRKSEKAPKLEDAKMMVDLEDEDFVSPENVFAEPEKDARQSRNGNRPRGHREERKPVSDFGLKPVEVPEVSDFEEEDVPPRRRRRGASAEAGVNEKKSAAIGGIVAGIVASKMKDETEKSARKAGKTTRSERPDHLEETEETSRRERSRRARRMPVEEVPQDDFLMEDEEELKAKVAAVEEEDAEVGIPNGARSRRRRRSQREKLEQTKGKAPAVMDDEDEESEDSVEEIPLSSKRSRRSARNRFQEELEDEKEIWSEVEIDEDEEEDADADEAPRGRRSRRSRRASARNSAQFDADEQEMDDVLEDDEDHVFTEVVDDEEDEGEDEEWETDFSQHDVPGWRYTIDFIVNSNLKARKREPSSMAGSIARINKRGGKRK